jgi:hypothetical protein
MMASVVTHGPETVVVTLEFQRKADLAGLIETWLQQEIPTGAPSVRS